MAVVGRSKARAPAEGEVAPRSRERAGARSGRTRRAAVRREQRADRSLHQRESGRAVAASSGEESRAMSRALSDSISCPIPQNLIHALKKAPDVDTSKHFFLQRL